MARALQRHTREPRPPGLSCRQGGRAVTPSIEEHRAELAELCRRHHVLRLSLFGSATRDDFDAERSDLDFLVDFESLSPGEHADAYFGLIESSRS